MIQEDTIETILELPRVEQCHWITETGERCKTIVRYGRGYCRRHQQPIALPADNWLKALVERKSQNENDRRGLREVSNLYARQESI